MGAMRDRGVCQCVCQHIKPSRHESITIVWERHENTTQDWYSLGIGRPPKTDPDDPAGFEYARGPRVVPE